MSTKTERVRESPYSGHLIAVGTRHGKQHQLAPAFDEILGARLLTPPDLDTDRFGTFSGDRPREGSPLDAARAKARLALEVSGLDYALSSEASYGPLPGNGCLGHEELLLFRDQRRGIEVIEGFRTTALPGLSHTVADWAELPASALAGLPTQGLIVHASGDPGAVVKGITDPRELRAAVNAAVTRSVEGRAVVQPDLRAHHNPSRQRVLTRLGEVMAHRLATACPRCATPGFGRVDTRPGLPCHTCETPTALPRWEIHRCCACDQTATKPTEPAFASPADCPYCNP